MKHAPTAAPAAAPSSRFVLEIDKGSKAGDTRATKDPISDAYPSYKKKSDTVSEIPAGRICIVLSQSSIVISSANHLHLQYDHPRLIVCMKLVV